MQFHRFKIKVEFGVSKSAHIISKEHQTGIRESRTQYSQAGKTGHLYCTTSETPYESCFAGWPLVFLFFMLTWSVSVLSHARRQFEP